MKVKKIMTKTVEVCGESDALSEACKIMWQKDCGVVPIVNKKLKVVGIITDRDIMVAAFLQNKTVSEINCSEIVSEEIISCTSADKVEDVLKLMKKYQVKRLPVVDEKEILEGIISITDILLSSGDDKKMRKKVLKTIEAISKPRPIVLKAIDE